jgi:hypothetical protein
MFVILLVLESNSLPIPTIRLRYDFEKAACIVSVAGNAVYFVACTALMATLARLAADATTFDDRMSEEVASSAYARRAGQGMTAAMAGLAA